jgi:hypothetical protein
VSDHVTILTTLGRRLVATKRIWLRPDQPPEIIEFDRPKFFQAFEREVDGLAALASLLAKVERHSRAMVIRGQLLSAANQHRVRRLRYARNGEDGDPCFEDVPRFWLLLDFDALEHPPGVDPSRDPEECVRIAARLLPPAFHGVSCWWQFTSGAGIKPGIRLRLGYWLDRPLGERELKRWLPSRPLDQSILSPVQPIYVAWPIFEEGSDPVPVRSGTFRGLREEVPVPSILEPAGDGGSDQRGLGYAGYCGLIGDHPGGEGFHDPTKAAIAAWVGKHGAGHPTAWLRRDIERVIRAANRSAHSEGYIEEKVAELDGLIAWTVERERTRPPKQNQATETAAIAGEAPLFHAPGDEAFADIDVRGHRETHPVRSKAFKQWLSLKHYSKHGKPPASDAVEQALVLTEARARYEAPERQVHLRVARLDDRVYLDLADVGWRAVEVDAGGWRVVERPPVRFRRTAGMLPLPVPKSGGKVEVLKDFLNVDDDGFKLAVAWQLAALGGRGPYPILAIYGENGGAKTSTGRYGRRVFDPNELMSRSLPAIRPRPLHLCTQRARTALREHLEGAGLAERHALPPRHGRRLQHAGALSGHRRDAVPRHAAARVRRDREFRRARRPGRPVDKADARTGGRREEARRKRDAPGVRDGAPLDPRRAADGGFLRLTRDRRDQVGEAAAHGGLRALGRGVRGRAVGARRFPEDLYGESREHAGRYGRG